jgi:hypothetical protein
MYMIAGKKGSAGPKNNTNAIVLLCSEKQRVPGWTDRIVFKGKQLKQIQYDRANLYTSDHRPGKTINWDSCILLTLSFVLCIVLALFETKVLRNRAHVIQTPTTYSQPFILFLYDRLLYSIKQQRHGYSNNFTRKVWNQQIVNLN